MSLDLEAMKVEYCALKNKIHSLLGFIHGDTAFKSICELEQSRMIKQLGSMESYASILESRIWVAKSDTIKAEPPHTGMTLGRATIHARQGLKIARSGWNGSGMYIYIVPARTEENSGPEFLDIPYIYYQASWALKSYSGHISTWTPSASDSLAEDWVIVT
jgi:hypothetical protein